MPYALCPMPYMPYALCPMPYALCPTVPHFSEKGYITLCIDNQLKNLELFSLSKAFRDFAAHAHQNLTQMIVSSLVAAAAPIVICG